MIAPADSSSVARFLAAQPAWRRDGDKLFREFVFDDFVTAFSFMTASALIAERMNHHPEWANVYRTVRVHLTTHDAGGISELDFQLARAMDALAVSKSASSGGAAPVTG